MNYLELLKQPSCPNAIKSQLNAVLFSVWQFSINSFGFELSENEGSELNSCKKETHFIVLHV